MKTLLQMTGHLIVVKYVQFFATVTAPLAVPWKKIYMSK